MNCVVAFSCTNQKGVSNGTERQPIEPVDTTDGGSTLTPKALCVDDTVSRLSGHHIKPTEVKVYMYIKQPC